MEERLKNLEVEIAYLRKAIEELKEMRTVEIHTHYISNIQNLIEPVEDDFPEPLY
jgi:uncharacterized coiled-coil protein SlyX